jgi:hypothetical protein
VTLEPSGSEKDGQKSNDKGERSGFISFTNVKDRKDNEVVEGDGEDHDDDDDDDEQKGGG